MWLGLSIWLALDFTDARALVSKGHGDGTDFSVHSSGKYDTAGASFGDRRRAVGNVEAVTGAGVLIKNRIAILVYWKRFTCKESLVGFEVQGFDDTALGSVT